MTVKCFSLKATIVNDAIYITGEERFQRSKDIRDKLRDWLKNPNVSTVVLVLNREQRDPVENTAS